MRNMKTGQRKCEKTGETKDNILQEKFTHREMAEIKIWGKITVSSLSDEDALTLPRAFASTKSSLLTQVPSLLSLSLADLSHPPSTPSPAFCLQDCLPP